MRFYLSSTLALAGMKSRSNSVHQPTLPPYLAHRNRPHASMDSSYCPGDRTRIACLATTISHTL
jgi:hypothetical protein